MRIKDTLDTIGKKRLIIITNISFALLILVLVLIIGNSNKKNPDKSKVSGKVDSSMVDESSQTDSIVDSKADSSSVLDKDKLTTMVTTKTPAVKPVAPDNVSIKFEVVGFQSANTTPKYSFPVPLFERIFGKTKNINGSMGKYVQQGDTIKIKITSGSDIPKIEPIGDVSFVSFQNGIATIKISDTAKKNVYNNFERLPKLNRENLSQRWQAFKGNDTNSSSYSSSPGDTAKPFDNNSSSNNNKASDQSSDTAKPR